MEMKNFAKMNKDFEDGLENYRKMITSLDYVLKIAPSFVDPAQLEKITEVKAYLDSIDTNAHRPKKFELTGAVAEIDTLINQVQSISKSKEWKIRDSFSKAEYINHKMNLSYNGYDFDESSMKLVSFERKKNETSTEIYYVMFVLLPKHMVVKAFSAKTLVADKFIKNSEIKSCLKSIFK